MAAPRNRIGELLVKARVLDEMQLRSALARHDQWGGRLSRIISDMGLVPEDTLTQAICQGLGVQRVQLDNLTKDLGALAKLDVGFAEQKGIFPVALRDNGKTLMLAMADPTDLETIDQVAARGRTRVIPLVAGDLEIQNAILRHYRNQEPAVGTHAPVHQHTPEEDTWQAASAPRPSGGGASAADLLDEILSASPPRAEVFSPEELQRLQAVRVNQEKSSKILRALLELLLEKGALQQRELAERMRS
jgi:Type II secretion system (T2SS), protein E, N-terminal domain